MSSRKRRKSGEQTTEVDIAPLIDVVFLLVVFFMSIWQAAHIEVEGELSLPRASQADPELQQDRDRLIINVDRDGDYFVANRRLGREELMGLLVREGQQDQDDDGFSNRPVYIRGDANLPFAQIQEVMSMCRQARVWKLTLRTQGEAEESP